MSLITALEENFFATGRYWGYLNSSIMQIRSIWAMSTGIPAADLNWVWNEKKLTSSDSEAIIKIKDHYTKLVLPFWWWVYPSGESPGLQELFLNNGFYFLTALPCLIADVSSPSTSGRSDESALKISLVETKRDLRLWAELSFTGFEMAGETKKQYNNFVMKFDIGPQSPQKLFVASFKEKPVASSLLFFHNNTAGIYFVSTLPAYRRKSIGLAVTRAAMLYAREYGATYSVLQSSEAGLNVYKKAGFQECCEAQIYIPY